jgi:hypothetical protein
MEGTIMAIWVVNTCVQGALRPIEVKLFDGRTAEVDARAYAERQRERVRQKGSTHVVRVGEVVTEQRA